MRSIEIPRQKQIWLRQRILQPALMAAALENTESTTGILTLNMAREIVRQTKMVNSALTELFDTLTLEEFDAEIHSRTYNDYLLGADQVIVSLRLGNNSLKMKLRHQQSKRYLTVYWGLSPSPPDQVIKDIYATANEAVSYINAVIKALREGATFFPDPTRPPHGEG